jgi:phage gpG-like protein
LSNSAIDFQRIWQNKIERVQRVIRRLPRDLGNEALLFFLNLFKKEESPEGEKWQARKNGSGDRSTRRGLLVKSGRLRKSIRLNVDGARIRIGTSTPYAKYHNEGTNRIPQRKFIGRSKALERRLLRMIKAKILWEVRK